MPTNACCARCRTPIFAAMIPCCARIVPQPLHRTIAWPRLSTTSFSALASSSDRGRSCLNLPATIVHRDDLVMNGLRSGALALLVADLSDMDIVADPRIVRRRSRDFFWYSPILNQQLDGKSADLIIAPRDEAEVVRVAAACARHRVSLTVRAGGTGNYGQAVPLEGGVLLDVTALAAVECTRPGIMRVGAGAKLNAIDAELRPLGQELRMHPSTKRTATIGGFVAGGSGGIGSGQHRGLPGAG